MEVSACTFEVVLPGAWHGASASSHFINRISASSPGWSVWQLHHRVLLLHCSSGSFVSPNLAWWGLRNSPAGPSVGCQPTLRQLPGAISGFLFQLWSKWLLWELIQGRMMVGGLDKPPPGLPFQGEHALSWNLGYLEGQDLLLFGWGHNRMIS